jgi:hypothetical protein
VTKRVNSFIIKMRFTNLPETLGRTPHVRLSKLFPDLEVRIKDEH